MRTLHFTRGVGLQVSLFLTNPSQQYLSIVCTWHSWRDSCAYACEGRRDIASVHRGRVAVRHHHVVRVLTDWWATELLDRLLVSSDADSVTHSLTHAHAHTHGLIKTSSLTYTSCTSSGSLNTYSAFTPPPVCTQVCCDHLHHYRTRRLHASGGSTVVTGAALDWLFLSRYWWWLVHQDRGLIRRYLFGFEVASPSAFSVIWLFSVCAELICLPWGEHSCCAA